LSSTADRRLRGYAEIGGAAVILAAASIMLSCASAEQPSLEPPA
jgi:hypothetical protein